MLGTTKSRMTFNANRFDIEPMLGFVTGMMILLCLFGAVFASQGIRTCHFTNPNSLINGSLCFHSFWVYLSKPFSSLSSNFLAFSTLCILFSCCSTFFAFVVFNFATSVSLMTIFALCIPFLYNCVIYSFSILFDRLHLTNFALITESIFFGAISVKFSNRLDLFANSTPFCYDLLGHDFLLSRKLCFEPIASTYLRLARFILTPIFPMSRINYKEYYLFTR